MYVYIQSEPNLWTVGFYTPDGKWHPEKDFSNPDEAAKRVAYLNNDNHNFLDQALNSGDGTYRP